MEEEYEKRQLENLVRVQVAEIRRLRKRIIRLECSSVYRILSAIGDILLAWASKLWEVYHGKSGKDNNIRGHKAVFSTTGGQRNFVIYTEPLHKQKKKVKRTLWKDWYARLLPLLKWRQDGAYAGAFKTRKALKGTNRISTKSRIFGAYTRRRKRFKRSARRDS